MNSNANLCNVNVNSESDENTNVNDMNNPNNKDTMEHNTDSIYKVMKIVHQKFIWLGSVLVVYCFWSDGFFVE